MRSMPASRTSSWPEHSSNLSGQDPGEPVHSFGVQVHRVGEEIGALELVEEMLVQHDDIGFGGNLANRAVQFGRMRGRRLGSAGHAQEDELGARAAVVLDDATVPAPEIPRE